MHGPLPFQGCTHRLLSTLATFTVMSAFMMGWFYATFALYSLLKSRYFWITILAVTWTIWDRHTPNRGGRRWRPLRDLPIFRWWSYYFPITLIKTCELSPKNNYIFGYHPHGYVGVGCTSCFMTEAVDVSSRFPGLRFTLLTTRLAYIHPVFREMFLFLGASNASKENMRYITQNSAGNVLVLVIGGAAEILDARPGMSRLVLKDRKGYARMAIETGCQLVPVYAFGENDLYRPWFSNPLGSTCRKIQRRLQLLKGLPTVMVSGPSRIFGWIPYPHPINVVVGKPIPAQKNIHPTEEEVLSLHETYKKRLKELFDEHKHRYGYGKNELEYI